MGLSTTVPDYDEARDGLPELASITPTAPAVVVWAFAYGTRKGDVLRFTMTSGGDEIFSHDERMERTQAQRYQFAGRRPPEGGWPTGLLTAEVQLIRNGAVIEFRTTEARVE